MPGDEGLKFGGLFSVPEEDYGDQYRAHLLEQYQKCVDMADKVSERRNATNAFFLSINTAILGLMAIGRTPSLLWLLVVCTAGVVLCGVWFAMVGSYRQLNAAKFTVIHAIEHELPVAPYKVEQRIIDDSPTWRKRSSFTSLEIVVPGVFGAIYVLRGVASLFGY